MSKALAIPVVATVNVGPPPPVMVRRTPFYLESQGQGLFAWLHRGEHAPPAHHGVILCPPLGYEQVHSHRGLRHLADALAQAGFLALRFDYHGTGDSAGTDEDPERYAVWLANVRDAHSWLQRQPGCRGISLVGLRLGAALAAEAASSLVVDGLVLWAPVVKGRSYVREMKALSLTANGSAPPSAEASADMEAAGFVLTAPTAQELSRLDLLSVYPQCRRALLVGRDDTPTDPRLFEHLTALGIAAEQTTQPGYADLMAEPHRTKVPREAIARTVDWLRAGISEVVRTDGEVYRDPCEPLQAIIPHGQGSGNIGSSPSDIHERVLYLSRRPELFGIVSESSRSSVRGLPFIVMLNAGSSYRVGPNRLHVSLARRLAARGFPCLRMDLSGLGDSVATNPDRENDPYPATAFRDIDLTLTHLRTELGVERVVLMGLCSGAYAAFQSAAQLSNSILVESIPINPLTFHWREGMSLDASPAEKIQLLRSCMKSIWDPRKWLKVLSGRSKIGVLGVMRMLMERWRLRTPSVRNDSVSPCADARDGFPSHPLQDDLPGDLVRIERRGRHLTCVFARSDPGYSLLLFLAGRKVNELCDRGRMKLFFIDDADHTFSRQGRRRALEETLTEHLCRRYLLSPD